MASPHTRDEFRRGASPFGREPASRPIALTSSSATGCAENGGRGIITSVPVARTASAVMTFGGDRHENRRLDVSVSGVYYACVGIAFGGLWGRGEGRRSGRSRLSGS